MKWFAAHIVMMVKLKARSQQRFPVWENIVLVAAKSEREAMAKAETLGRAEAGDEDGSFRWNGEPAAWSFIGVRKLTRCAMPGDRPDDGDEVTYTEMELDSLEAVERLAAGESTELIYTDRFRKPRATKPSAPAAKRKGA